jgi:hypothetical protein
MVVPRTRKPPAPILRPHKRLEKSHFIDPFNRQGLPDSKSGLRPAYQLSERTPETATGDAGGVRRSPALIRKARSTGCSAVFPLHEFPFDTHARSVSTDPGGGITDV